MSVEKIDLAADVNIGQMVSRRMQQAFKYGMDNDIIQGGVLAGQTDLQGIIVAPRAVQNCVIGSRRVTPKGKVYRYAEASGNCSSELLAYSTYRLQALNWSALVSGALGSTTVVVTVGAGDGDGTGAIAANDLAGGELFISNTGGLGSFSVGIVSNTATVAPGGAMTIVIDTPLPWLMANTYNVEGMGCMYRGVNAVVNCPADASAIGRPTTMATAALPFHWEQTWGLCWLTPNNGFCTVNVGNTAYNSAIVMYNGTIGPHDDAVAQTVYQQHIGFVVSRAQGGTTQGAPFIMLQISP